MKLSLNRIACPSLDMKEFFTLAKEAGVSGVELRNDIRDGKILDGKKPSEVKKLAANSGVDIVSINALQKFNLNTNLAKAMDEMKYMLEISVESGCKAIVLCPNNCTSDTRSRHKRHEETVVSLKSIGKLLKGTNIMGLVEPLGFGICSIRSKEDAIQAIRESGYADCFKLVHDTFHHYLGTDDKMYPGHTGLLHISGVIDSIPKESFTDNHRIFVTRDDVMDNAGQIKYFKDNSFKGYYSFEPFSDKVQNMSPDKMLKELKKSIQLVKSF